MKERPILFSGPMVRALLDGSKTQTRRIVKPTGAHHIFQFRGTEDARGADEPTGKWAWCRAEKVVSEHIRCPYGKPGDRLWVRETWRGVVEINPPGKTTELGVARYVPDQQYCRRVEYQATQKRDGDPWRPSIHMPRWASRITLEVTGVRVERLQDIGATDARAEGIEFQEHFIAGNVCRSWKAYDSANGWYPEGVDSAPIFSYRSLWDSLNAGRGYGWEANPWVWVIEFKRVQS